MTIQCEMRCRGCNYTEVIERAYEQGFTRKDKFGKWYATGFCPSCAKAHEHDEGAQYIGEETELYAYDPIDGHNLLLDLPDIKD